jgi:hypothetical protein
MGNMIFILHNKVAHILFTESGTLYIIIIDLPLKKKKKKKNIDLPFRRKKKKKIEGVVTC